MPFVHRDLRRALCVATGTFGLVLVVAAITSPSSRRTRSVVPATTGGGGTSHSVTLSYVTGTTTFPSTTPPTTTTTTAVPMTTTTPPTKPPPPPPPPPPPAASTVSGDYHTWPDWARWQRLGRCEQPGDGPDGIAWTHTGRYPGGLGILNTSWTGAGGTDFAPSGNLATPAQQIVVARRIQARYGWSAWGCATSFGW